MFNLQSGAFIEVLEIFRMVIIYYLVLIHVISYPKGFIICIWINGCLRLIIWNTLFMVMNRYNTLKGDYIYSIDICLLLEKGWTLVYKIYLPKGDIFFENHLFIRFLYDFITLCFGIQIAFIFLYPKES